MEMPGGWSMSMTWMRMPGQSWPGAAMAFLGMWAGMMMAMMLPAITPALWRHRRAMRSLAGQQPGWLTAVVAVAYFVVWTLAGLATFPLGVVLAELAMQYPAVSSAVPVAAGLTLLLAGASQFTAWKAGKLRCCRAEPIYTPGARAAWQYGVRLGLNCVQCCAGLTAILLVLGMMDLRVMAIVAMAITAERVSPAGQRVARLIGAIAMLAGLIQLARI